MLAPEWICAIGESGRFWAAAQATAEEYLDMLSISKPRMQRDL